MIMKWVNLLFKKKISFVGHVSRASMAGKWNHMTNKPRPLNQLLKQFPIDVIIDW